MAHHKSAKRRIVKNKKRNLINKSSISKLKTLSKRVLESTDKETSEKEYKNAVAFIDRMATKNRIHKNTASRKKSILTRHLNSLSSSK